MKLTLWPPSKPKPYDKNPRVISDDAVAKVARSIEEFGFNQPVVVDRKGVIVVGHTRARAALKLGLKKIPVIVASHLTEEQARAYRIMDNRSNEEAQWDQRMLLDEIETLGADGVDLALTGFSTEQLDRLQAGEDLYGMGELEREDEAPDGDADDAPRLGSERKAESKIGEVYALGPHRLLCGDSTDDKAVGRLLGKERIDLVWTDPPYGVSYVGGTDEALKVLNDDLDEKGLEALLRASLGLAHKLCNAGAPWYVAAPGGPLFHVFGTVLRHLEVWRETILWVKDSLVLSRQDMHWRHEPLFHGAVGGTKSDPTAEAPAAETKDSDPLFYGWKAGRHFWRGGRKQDTVWEIPRPKRSTDHPTMKPVALVQRCILNSTRRKALVYDPFGGSGTTLIAAAKAGCRARLCELSPAYCDVIRRRWTKLAVENGIEPGNGALDEQA